MPIISTLRCPRAILRPFFLRKDSPETRIIFISGRDDPSVRQAALDAGAFGFLSRPFDDEALLQFVRKAIAS
jgi:DNA-binding NarL/FixJ family response regulator